MRQNEGDRGRARRSSRGGTGVVVASAIALLYVAGVWAAAQGGYLPRYLPVVYVAMSLVTYMVYRGDKMSARAETWRTSEQTLHLLEVLGGWPGALIAQWHIKHKNRKASYQFVFWLIVALHLGAFVMLMKPQ